RSGTRAISRGHSAIGSRPAPRAHDARIRGRRARFRPWHGSGHAGARRHRHARALPLGSRHRREGCVSGRAAARRRGKARHLAILCRARRACGRRKASPRHPRVAASAVSETRVKPAPFDYVRAETLEEALEVLRAEGPDARVLAGGQTLIPMLNMRLARPKLLIDIMRVPALARIEHGPGGIRVGAAVRQRELERELNASHQPLLAAGLPWVGHAQTRSRGTVCGSVAHADPSAELPLILIALGGEIEL